MSEGRTQVSMLSLLEKDRESILHAMEAAGSAEKIVSVLSEECSRLLVKYNETCDDPYCRQAAAGMMRALQSAVWLTDTVGETRIWERKENGGKEAEKPQMSAKHHVLLFLGIAGLAAAAMFLFLTFGKTFPVKAIPWTAGFLIVSSLCFYASGRSVRHPVPSVKQQVETVPDVNRIWRIYAAAIQGIDQELEQILRGQQQLLTERSEESIAREDSYLWTLLGQLLEAGKSGDGAYCLEQAAQVPYYLHRRGIQEVSYNGKNRDWFDVLPSRESSTIRPALVYEGTLLARGLAAEAED